MPTSTAKARTKSTTPPRTDATGIARRGKYTFLISSALVTRLFDDWFRGPSCATKRWRWSDALLHEVLTLQRLLADPSPIALYDAGEAIASQLPAVFRAIGRGVEIPHGLFEIKALLNGREIASLSGLEPGPQLGATKRALLEAQIRGEVLTRADAERFVANQIKGSVSE